jgi:hypothetical protein
MIVTNKNNINVTKIVLDFLEGKISSKEFKKLINK